MVMPDQIAGPEARYRLLETLRQYALERLRQRGKLDAVQRRHAQHFAAFAKQAGTALLGPDELAWRPRLRAEQDNLRAAVQFIGPEQRGSGLLGKRREMLRVAAMHRIQFAALAQSVEPILAERLQQSVPRFWPMDLIGYHHGLRYQCRQRVENRPRPGPCAHDSS